MKIIIDSQLLASYLHAFDHEGSPVERVGFFDGKFRVVSYDYAADVPCEISEGSRSVWFDQSDCRWDWLEKTLRDIVQQPVVLEIGVNKLNLILSF